MEYLEKAVNNSIFLKVHIKVRGYIGPTQERLQWGKRMLRSSEWSSVGSWGPSTVSGKVKAFQIIRKRTLSSSEWSSVGSWGPSTVSGKVKSFSNY
jgi:hypothetical protein